MTDEEIWQSERELWLSGAAAYQRLIDEACLMAFPSVGILSAQAVLESLEDAPRWENVEMTTRSVGRGGSDTIVLAYHAVGRRTGAEPYHCLCTSTYRRENDRWLLIQHQQMPDDL